MWSDLHGLPCTWLAVEHKRFLNERGWRPASYKMGAGSGQGMMAHMRLRAVDAGHTACHVLRNHGRVREGTVGEPETELASMQGGERVVQPVH